MRLGVFGGTFDPVHVGHLVLAEAAREQLSLDRVLWVPAGDPWRKRGRHVSPTHDRVEMVRRAVQDNTGFEVRMDEVERSGPSYTMETLGGIHAENPDADLYLLLGEDALSDLPQWRSPKGIVELAKLAVAGRENVTPAPALEQVLSGRADGIVRIIMPAIGISSTDIRERVSKGASIRYLVPDRVAAYIQEVLLYRA